MSRSFLFIVLMGIVSLFGDMTYEGGRSILGPFLSSLGASGFIVGFVTGLGELAGYGLRYVSGFLTDQTKRYWLIAGIGYVVNLIAVPLLGLAGNWEIAGALIVAERMGKGLRKPPRDAMLSFAAKETGRGWGFGLHEAFDQVGAILGPLLVTAIQAWKGSYEWSFGVLAIPALCALAVFFTARLSFLHPQKLEKQSEPIRREGKFPKAFWIYVAACSLMAFGYADFPLIAFHLEEFQAIPTSWIPIFYAIAMAVDGIAAFVFGKLYDLKGIQVLFFAALLSAGFAPFAFSEGWVLPLIGIVMWGIGMGTQESIMRAAIPHWIGKEKRATAYGIFNLYFGVSWFLGGSILGALYDLSPVYLMIFSVILQVASLPLFLRLKHE